jgi:protein-S-isoprenylcysteine O-methyltransferase Ste14
VSCVRLFAKSGDGTPAPWDPVDNLIITGPYSYVRNPMLSGVIIILFSEALVFWSLPFFIYTMLFVLLNMAYFPLVEEPGLIKKYGAAYKIYMNNVPRWIPLIKPYHSDDM